MPRSHTSHSKQPPRPRPLNLRFSGRLGRMPGRKCARQDVHGESRHGGSVTAGSGGSGGSGFAPGMVGFSRQNHGAVQGEYEPLVAAVFIGYAFRDAYLNTILSHLPPRTFVSIMTKTSAAPIKRSGRSRTLSPQVWIADSPDLGGLPRMSRRRREGRDGPRA